MRIAFTGHRDRLVNPVALDAIADEFPGAVWVHGGAGGFDSQVAAAARRHHLPQEVIRPDYRSHPPRQAPLIRNRQILTGAAMLVACYDGRQSGGTAFTVRLAKEQGIRIRFLAPREAAEPEPCPR